MKGAKRPTWWISRFEKHALYVVGALTLIVSVPLPAVAYFDGDSPFPTDPQATPLYAIRPPEVFYHNVGLLEIMVTNVGVVGNPGFIATHGGGWQGGDYLYAAALWIGAVAPDNLSYVSTGVAYESTGAKFETLPSLDPIDTIYPTFEGATGGDRLGFSASGGDDDQDGVLDEDPPNGKDDDQDGLIDEDYAAISQQMFSCEYWDYGEVVEASNPAHRPLHVKIRQDSYAWSTAGANEFVGLDYTITNDGFETLRDLFIGYFVDSDAGNAEAEDYYTDDAGFLQSRDTLYADPAIAYRCEQGDGTTRDCSQQRLRLDIAYMHDVLGNEPGGVASDDMAPGSRGYFGGMFLGHTTDPFGEEAPSQVQIHTCRFFSRGGTYPTGDPRNDFERYDLLSAGDQPRRPTNQPGDYRYCFSAGPFRELLPGESLEFQVAFVIGNEWQGLLHNALMAQRIYNGQWRDADHNPLTGCDGEETCLHIEYGGEPLFWLDPCDSLSPVQGPIRNYACDDPEYWVDNDCDCCTPLQKGVDCEGLETLIHWVGEVAPPPPQTSTSDPGLHARLAGDRKIHLEWDNSSEMVADPITGEVRFCGYRIWRVENWKRPTGSIGPIPEEWQLIADLNHDPVGNQLHLGEHVNPYAAITDTLPHPSDPDAELYQYEIGRYFFEDDVGLKNGMLYFYDVTAYSCWVDDQGDYQELASQPAATESEGVRPTWGATEVANWQDQVMVVPNPWRGSAAWDLRPSDYDPTGSHIDFARLPARECDLRIYTLTGDLVESFTHDGSNGDGTIRWNMLSRNGQHIASGVYLYAVTCEQETRLGRFTVIR